MLHSVPLIRLSAMKFIPNKSKKGFVFNLEILFHRPYFALLWGRMQAPQSKTGRMLI